MSPPRSRIPSVANVLLVGLSVTGMGILACGMLTLQPRELEAESDVRLRVEPAKGGVLALADGARLEIPAGSLPTDGEVRLRRVEPGSSTGGEAEFTSAVGSRYEVDLGGQNLAGPVTLEIPFDRTALPSGEDPEHVFLSYFDEARDEWVFAGGKVDLERDVVTIEVDHASWWQPATWNWEAWAAAVNRILSGNIVSMVEGVALLLDECRQEGQYVSVDTSGANGLIQGCVEHDDARAPEFRIVNPRAVYVEVQPMAGWAYFEPTLLAPGASLRFQVDAGKALPFVASADVTQKAGLRAVVHMTLAMLPGFNQLSFQPEALACLTERLGDAAYFFSAAEALADNNGLAAIEKLTRFMLDKEAAARFLASAKDCDYGPAATWSLAGLGRVGASLATIQSSWELISTYFGNTHGQVSFQWATSPEAVLPGKIVYATLVPNTDPARYQLHLTDGAGSTDRVVTEDSYWPDTDLSPDGTKLVYVRLGEAGGPEEIGLFDLVSDSSELLVPSERTGSGMYPESPYAYMNVRWSADGGSVYYIRTCFCSDVDSLWRVDVANRSSRERLADLGTRVSGFSGFFEISPTTGQLLMVSIDPAKGSYEVSLANPGTIRREPVSTSNKPRGCPAPFSPDGMSFAYSAWIGDYASIFVKSLGGSSEVQVTQGSYLDACPSWSPDGRWIVFPRYVNIPGNADLWAVSVVDGRSMQITDTPDRSEEMPDWGP